MGGQGLHENKSGGRAPPRPVRRGRAGAGRRAGSGVPRPHPRDIRSGRAGVQQHLKGGGVRAKVPGGGAGVCVVVSESHPGGKHSVRELASQAGGRVGRAGLSGGRGS